MEWIVNAEEMKYCDKNTIEYYGIPSLVLMERAALKVTEAMERAKCSFQRVLVVCGSGNNGGDGFAVARLLHLKGHSVEILVAGDKGKFTEETKRQYEICLHYHVPMTENIRDVCYSEIVDALFGIGLSRNLDGNYAKLIRKLNDMSGTKIAVDIPSGISTDNGRVMGTAFKADFTVTFAYRKLGHVLYPGKLHTGRLIIADPGIGRESWLDREAGVFAFAQKDLYEKLKRVPDGNKGTFGKVLIVAGSPGMAGAAYFAAKAAYKSGCGLVRIYTAQENRIILQTKLPEAILTTYSGMLCDTQKLYDAMAWADVIVAGPGLGRDKTADDIVHRILESASVPVVLDADALNMIAGDTSVLLRTHTDLTVTPHLGEMARLTGKPAAKLKEHLIAEAQAFADKYGVICVLKDAVTVTAVANGRTYLNLSGNDGMATGGSGDVLSGIIGGLIAQGLGIESAVPAAVFWHGLAGEKAAAACGRHGTLASDIIEGLDQCAEMEECVKWKR